MLQNKNLKFIPSFLFQNSLNQMCRKVTFLSPELDLEFKDGQFFLMVKSPTLKKWSRYNKYEFITSKSFTGKATLTSPLC